MASPDGYSWQNGEVVTATKLNEASLPALAAEDSAITLGQTASRALVLKWTYNATAGDAFGILTTFGQSNDLYIQAKNIYFDTPSLAFAVQMFTNGRVRVGGGSDDVVNAFQVNGVANNTGGLRGVATNSSAASGIVGEYLNAAAAASSVSLTTATSANLASVSLTAGDWMVSATANFAAVDASTVTTDLWAGISTTSATLPGESDGLIRYPYAVSTTNSAYASAVVAARRISLASTTTIYLVGRGYFTVSGLNGGGVINAWRVR